MEYHNILSKQIKKLLPEHYLADEAILLFLESISNSYHTFDRSQKISEHAFNISEREYQEINNHLYKEIEIKQRSISEIKKAISSLSPDSLPDMDNSDDDLIRIIHFLQEQINKP